MGEIFNAPITETTTIIWEDNQSAIPYSENALVSETTKHIGLKWTSSKTTWSREPSS
jgi:hypothetical protein